MTGILSRADAQIVHGYTLHDINNLARLAVHTDLARNGININDRMDAAVHAIAVALCSTDEPPSRNDLLRAGQVASMRSLERDLRHHGVNTDAGHNGESRTSFARYWTGIVGDALEDRVVDRVSLAQIWVHLHPGQQSCLLALATVGDYAQAAETLGLTYKGFCGQVRKARLRFLELWHQGETPSSVWAHDRRSSPRGTARGPMNNLRLRDRARRVSAEGPS